VSSLWAERTQNEPHSNSFVFGLVESAIRQDCSLVVLVSVGVKDGLRHAGWAEMSIPCRPHWEDRHGSQREVQAAPYAEMS
jgi:hypothetical protein